MSAELISKLTAKMRQIDGVGFGGSPTLTSQDVAGALAGAHRFGYLLVLAKYADDNTSSQLLWTELAQEIAKDRGIDYEKARGIALACIFPVVSPMRCHHCHGRGTIYPRTKGQTREEAAYPCRHCEGTGRGEISERQKASMAQIASTTWHDTWKHYAAKKEQFLWSLESSVLGRLRARLQDAA